MRLNVDDALHGLVDWREASACRDADPDLFFPVSSGVAGQMQTDQAKSVCHGCAVVEQCLSFALATHQDEGIWGGLTPAERQSLRRAVPMAPSRQVG